MRKKFKRLMTIILALSVGVIVYISLMGKNGEKRVATSRFWVNLAWRFWPWARARVMKNVRLLRPDLQSDEEVSAVAKSIAYTLGANLAYAHSAWREKLADVRHRMVIEPSLRELAAEVSAGIKTLVLVVHVAPFDGVASIAEELGINAGIVVERVSQPLQWFFDRGRRSWKGINLIHQRRGRTHQEAAAFLAEHHLVAVFADIFRQPREGDPVCRFGKAELGLSTMAIRLAVEQGAKVRVLLLEQLPDGRVRLDASEFPLRRSETEEATIDNETVRVTEEVIIPHLEKHTAHWMRPVPDEFKEVAA